MNGNTQPRGRGQLPASSRLFWGAVTDEQLRVCDLAAQDGYSFRSDWLHIGELRADGLSRDVDDSDWSEGLSLRNVSITRQAPLPAPQARPLWGAEPTSRLCPCREPAREGSAYCSYDCEPTHLGVHTDTRQGGDLATPMRWRPDLVSNIDDSALTPCTGRLRRGPYWSQVFERPGAEPGTRCYHLRLDDDHRFVGADLVIADEEDGYARTERHRLKWEALERELGNARHQVPQSSIPDQSVALVNAVRTARERIRAVAPAPRPAEDALARMVGSQHVLGNVLLDGVARSLAQFRRSAAALAPVVAEPTPPTVAEQRAETLRRVRAARGAGPQHRGQPPRRIDPTGRR